MHHWAYTHTGALRRFDPGHGPGYCHAVGRCCSLVFAFFLAAGCSSPQETSSNLPEVEEERTARPLPGEPVLLNISTDRPSVVRLIEVEEVTETGRLQISSTEPGVMVSVDGEAQVALPLVLDVVTGLHEVIATCPNASTETMNITVEAGATVHLRVCNQLRQP